MAINTTSFLNTPQAEDDLFTSATTGLTEDALFITYLAVIANDRGGAAPRRFTPSTTVQKAWAFSAQRIS